MSAPRKHGKDSLDVHVRLPAKVVKAVRASAAKNGRTFPIEMAFLLGSHPSLLM